MFNLGNPCVQPLFSIPVYSTQVEGYTNNVIDFDNIDYSQFMVNETQGLTFNSIDQNILLQDSFKDIKDIVDSGVEQYAYDFLKLPRELNLKLVCSWLVLGHPNSVTNYHMHVNSVFSGVFYIKSDENSGELVFKIPLSHLTYITPTIRPEPTEYNMLNSSTWSYQPVTNSLIIFPSHLQHSVSENLSGDFRCAVAFNYFLTGKVSDHNTAVLTI